jgi:hypothetical protein
LYGTIRYKTPQQIVDELEALYRLGHRRNVFLLDDDFCGRHREAEAIVDAIIVWQKKRGYPFLLYTQSDIGLGVGRGAYPGKENVRGRVLCRFFGAGIAFKKGDARFSKDNEREQ